MASVGKSSAASLHPRDPILLARRSIRTGSDDSHNAHGAQNFDSDTHAGQPGIEALTLAGVRLHQPVQALSEANKTRPSPIYRFNQLYAE